MAEPEVTREEAEGLLGQHEYPRTLVRLARTVVALYDDLEQMRNIAKRSQESAERRGSERDTMRECIDRLRSGFAAWRKPGADEWYWTSNGYGEPEPMTDAQRAVMEAT